MAFRFDPNDDLLTVINSRFLVLRFFSYYYGRSHGASHIIAQVCVYLFPAVALLTSIPVYSIIIRYNLMENNICRKCTAFFIYSNTDSCCKLLGCYISLDFVYCILHWKWITKSHQVKFFL